MLQSST